MGASSFSFQRKLYWNIRWRWKSIWKSSTYPSNLVWRRIQSSETRYSITRPTSIYIPQKTRLNTLIKLIFIPKKQVRMENNSWNNSYDHRSETRNLFPPFLWCSIIGNTRIESMYYVWLQLPSWLCPHAKWLSFWSTICPRPNKPRPTNWTCLFIWTRRTNHPKRPVCPPLET